MRFAVIEDGIVINIIKADQKFALDYSQKTGNVLVCVDGVYCDVGFSYVDGEFKPQE